jgi:predicted permease
VQVVAAALGPIVLLVLLGAGLARLRFLGPGFMADLNRLAFWVALPALLFRSAAHAAIPDAGMWRLLGVLVSMTAVVTGIAWLVSVMLRVPAGARGTFMQAAFRGNMAFIGIPVLASFAMVAPGAETSRELSTAAVVMTITMAFYNVLAVLVLQASRTAGVPFGARAMFVPVVTNPLLLSGLLGLSVTVAGLGLPSGLDDSLAMLAGAAVPIALLCIGGSLATARLSGRRGWILAAALLKVAALPLLVYAVAALAQLSGLERRIAVVFAATPTAAVSYVMAREMGGDEALASGSIVLSTILSPVTVGLALWLTS